MTEPLHEHEDAIVAAYAEGRRTEWIAERYGLTPAEVEHIVAGRRPPPRRVRGLASTGNRVLIGVGVGFIVATFARLLNSGYPVYYLLWVVTAVVAYAILTSVRSRS